MILRQRIRALESNDTSALRSVSPINGEFLGAIAVTTPNEIHRKIDLAFSAATTWRNVPAPARGEVLRIFATLLRQHKLELSELITQESGKILQEGLGEVQEMIDICDFAVGLSRQLYGLTMTTERRGHRMMETWHPLGVVGVITAWNFPMAVWAWNFAIAAVCGNSVVWKPSEKTPLCAIACEILWEDAVAYARMPEAINILQVLFGHKSVGYELTLNKHVALVSATGSTRMGEQVASVVANRLGKYLLELGGNNAAIVCPSADLDLVTRAVTFAAAGTAGQRCTSLRRLFVHESILPTLEKKLAAAYRSLVVGDPMESATHVGPLIDSQAEDTFFEAIFLAEREGGKVLVGGTKKLVGERLIRGRYVNPTIITMPFQRGIMLEETFGPILYVMPYTLLDVAIMLNNNAYHGLSSSIFTNDLREAEQFMSSNGSDCGIVNVNIGPSGAEIGGAFGGEKDTGGGREAGSDSWKAYMRRATNTINYSGELPLAQGIKFEV